MTVRLGVIGEFTPTFDPHRSTNDAIAHVMAQKDQPLSVDWLSSADLTDDLITDYSGLWVLLD
jgi:CTP synthase (UTP-ammonia lyase)